MFFGGEFNEKMQLNRQIITFYDRCEIYLENRRERNLREATVNPTIVPVASRILLSKIECL